MKKKIFCTIFPLCENVHLVKDVGMIPLHLANDYGYNSIIATYRNGAYPYLENEAKGVKLHFIRKFTGIPTIDVAIFLAFNARKIDVLQCFHLMKSSLIIIYFFKLITFFSRDKKTYLKMDVGVDLDESMPKARWQRSIISYINLISVENVSFYKILAADPLYANMIMYLPNGISLGNADLPKYTEKQNIILTVGRIGSYQKANHILLKAFLEFCITSGQRDWKLCLVGPQEGVIMEEYKRIYYGYDNIMSLVEFTGPIYDRVMLESYYRRAKMFVLSSKFEGFPLVFLEALKNGCTIVSTDFPAARDITQEGTHGFLFPVDDHVSLCNLFVNLTTKDSLFEERMILNQREAIKTYQWSDLVSKIHNRLK